MMPMRIHAIDEGSLPAATEPHETRGTSVLRPIVFGANDGLVSNLALVMGVAGASAEPGVIVLAGVAGLLAGAFSMGVGEYISVQSQRELLDYQIAFQHKQLREAPDQERRILRDVYLERGLTEAEADRFVEAVFEEPEEAARLLIFEEVGLDARSIGSPVAAAAGSFLAFTSGAFIPLLPYLLTSGTPAFVASLVVSLMALAILGGGIAVMTHRLDPVRRRAPGPAGRDRGGRDVRRRAAHRGERVLAAARLGPPRSPAREVAARTSGTRDRPVCHHERRCDSRWRTPWAPPPGAAAGFVASPRRVIAGIAGVPGGSSGR